MPRFNVRHGECQSVGEGHFVDAKDAREAIDLVDPMFQYPEFEHESWKGIPAENQRWEPDAYAPPQDIVPGTTVYIASCTSSPDYFLVYETTR